MQPQTPPPAPPPVVPGAPAGHDPYAFLKNDPVKKKKFSLPSGNSKKQRLLLVLFGAVLLVFAAMIVMSFLGKASKANLLELESAAKQQAELIRISDIGANKATDSSTKNLALTTKLTLLSDQPTLLAAIKKDGVSLKPKELSGNKNGSTDQLLTSAEQSNNFDSVFSAELNKELSAYSASLKKAYDSSNKKSTRAALSEAYNQANMLLTHKN